MAAQSIIPKIAHFYWGGRPLPFANALTIRSFRKANPDWMIWLWTAQSPQVTPHWHTGEQQPIAGVRDCWDLAIQHADNVVPAEFPDWLASAHDAVKSDFLLMKSVYDHGGAYFDMDILFARPVDLQLDAPLCLMRTHEAWQVAFMAGVPGIASLGKMMDFAKSEYQSSSYQSIGRFLWDRRAAWLMRETPGAQIVPCSKILPFPWDNLPLIFDTITPLPKDSWGVHWFNGSPVARAWVARITLDNYRRFDNTFSQLCRDHDL